jgi:hypothetical protein
MKQWKRMGLYFWLSIITIFIIFLSSCATEYEKSQKRLQNTNSWVSLTEIAYPGFWFKANKANKLEIIFLDKQSDAALEGFKEGDIISGFDDVVILNKHQYFEIINNKKPNEIIKLTVTRNGEFITKQIRLKSLLLPNTLYVIMKAAYNSEQVVLAPIVGEFNVAGVGNQEERDRFKKPMMRQLLSDVEGIWIKLLGNENNFRMVDRNDIDSIMSELKFQQSGLISRETQLKLGNMIGATHLLIIDYSFMQLNRNEFSYTITQKLVEIETGKVLATTFVKNNNSDSTMMQFIRKLKTEKE